MAEFLISDSHFGHLKAARSRGFETVFEHDSKLIRNIRRTVGTRGVLFWLGDVAFGGWRKTLERVAESGVFGEGEHHLVLGNHDRAHPLNSRSENYQREFLQYFSSVQVIGALRHAGIRAMLSHFPYNGDNGDQEDRHVEWRPADNGMPLIHGHVHSVDRLTFSDKGTPQVHVGVDAWDMRPVPVGEVFTLLRSAEG